MKKIKLFYGVLPVVILVLALSCQKEAGDELQLQLQARNAKSSVKAEVPPFNLEVILRSEGKGFGHVKFRQDADLSKIITLDVWVRDLEPNSMYQLQRAVDVKNEIDGNCTSTVWATLGLGSSPEFIYTDDKGMGTANLWRDLPNNINSGDAFDIHFRVVKLGTQNEVLEVVLESACYMYVVR